MNKILKKTVAVIMTALICLSFAGCHKANEVAVKVGDTSFTSAFYSCALVFADTEAKNNLSESLGDAYSEDTVYSQTIDGVSFVDWVKNRAMETLKSFAVYEAKCKENNIDMTSAFSSAEYTASAYWTYGYSTIMEANGVSLNTFKNYMKYNSYMQAYFDFLYGESGSKAISSDEINGILSEQYAYINIISTDATKLSETEYNEAKAKFDAYAERIKKGEKFAKIAAEYNGNTYNETEGSVVFSHADATILGGEGTSYESKYFSLASDMKSGDIKVVKSEPDSDGNSLLCLILKGDIFDESNTSLESLKNTIRWDLKGDEFDADLKAEIDSAAVTEIKRATKQFKVKNIKYPEA